MQQGVTYLLNPWASCSFLSPSTVASTSTSTSGPPSAGSQAGAGHFADLLSLVFTADAASVNPGGYIADVLPRIDTWPKHRLDEPLPHAWATAGEQLGQ